MRSPSLAILAAALLSAVAAPASAATKIYDLKGFDRIDASAGVTVVLAQGPFAVRAEEASGDFDQLRIEVRGSTLVVSRTSSLGFFWFWPAANRHYTVTIAAPAYNGVSASSGSSVSGQIAPADLDLSASSGAALRLSGTCGALRASASSGAHLDGADLHCRTADLEASSGGNISVWADSRVQGDASSGARIVVRGKPASVTSRQSSGGRLQIDPA